MLALLFSAAVVLGPILTAIQPPPGPTALVPTSCTDAINLGTQLGDFGPGPDDGSGDVIKIEQVQAKDLNRAIGYLYRIRNGTTFFGLGALWRIDLASVMYANSFVEQSTKGNAEKIVLDPAMAASQFVPVKPSSEAIKFLNLQLVDCPAKTASH